jgi:hypothetical protein
VIGNEATPAWLIDAPPSGAGVSLSDWSASTKPASSVTAVVRPDSWSTCATGSGRVGDEGSSSPPQAATPKASAAAARSIVSLMPATARRRPARMRKLARRRPTPIVP